MMTANEYRGEIAIDIGGAQRVLRPSFTALSEIETETGKALQQLTANAVSLTVSLTDMAIILTCGLRAAGEDVDRDQVGQWILDAGGAVEYYQPVGKFVVFGLTGGRDSDEEDRAKDDDAGEPMPERATRSGGWRRWLADAWGGQKTGSGDQPRMK
ncbi:hypothetical protein TH47_05950 [Thalassospira sp. MCCC 1A02803]|nr:hypothetical protein AUQ41_08395 [Thalassospira sp. MCCC 1A02898]ONH85387.1 hypothetical protein TH47_05950 [Thalassospira sp. MCCC 1A02803]